MNSYAEDPDGRGALLWTFPARGHQSFWDPVLGLDCTLISEYLEVAHSMNGEEVFGEHPIRVNQFRSLMCRELGKGDDDTHILRFMDEMTSVGGATSLIVAKEVNNDDGVVAGYVIVNLYVGWFIMTGKNLSGRHTETDTL